MDKYQISKRFGYACKTYESVAHVQKEAANVLLDLLFKNHPNLKPNTVLDVGAGTGYVTELLYHKFNTLSDNTQKPILYTLNDIAIEMLEYAKLKFKNLNFKDDMLEFKPGDMEELEFEHHSLIISNFALQWTNCLSSIIGKLYNSSDIFAFSCLLKGTFSEWNEVCKDNSITPFQTNTYPSETDMVEILKKYSNNFDYKIHEVEVTFGNIRSFLKYLKKLGASYSMSNICINSLKNLVRQNNIKFSTKYRIFFGFMGK